MTTELTKIYRDYEVYLLNDGKDPKEIQSLASKYVEQLKVDPAIGCQHVSASIDQLAASFGEVRKVELSSATGTKDLWNYVNCLELLTVAICTYSSDLGFSSLAEGLMLNTSGAATMFPSENYFPLRLRCMNMTNHLAAATNSNLLISSILVDMLDIQHKSPKQPEVSIDFRTILRAADDMLTSQTFQEKCVCHAVDELAEHLAQWSYSFIFPEVSAGTFCRLNQLSNGKSAVKDLITAIEKNSTYIKKKRSQVQSGPNSESAASFPQDLKNKGWSPLSKYVSTLREKAQESEGVAILKIPWPPTAEKKNESKKIDLPPKQPATLSSLKRKVRQSLDAAKKLAKR